MAYCLINCPSFRLLSDINKIAVSSRNLDQMFILRVYTCSCLVKDNDRCIFQDCSCYGNTLFFSTWLYYSQDLPHCSFRQRFLSLVLSNLQSSYHEANTLSRPKQTALIHSDKENYEIKRTPQYNCSYCEVRYYSFCTLSRFCANLNKSLPKFPETLKYGSLLWSNCYTLYCILI